MTPELRAFNNDVLQHLRDNLTNGTSRVGDADVPAENPPMPYCILTLRITSGGVGSFADIEEDRDYIFNVLCVGRSREQAQWMSDEVSGAMLNTPITTTDSALNVQNVATDSHGGIVKTGDILFQQADSYRVRAGQ